MSCTRLIPRGLGMALLGVGNSGCDPCCFWTGLSSRSSWQVHAYIISALKKEMPNVFGKESKKRELVNNLGEIYLKIEREHQISPGDFPNLRKMQVWPEPGCGGTAAPGFGVHLGKGCLPGYGATLVGEQVFGVCRPCLSAVVCMCMVSRLIVQS